MIIMFFVGFSRKMGRLTFVASSVILGAFWGSIDGTKPNDRNDYGRGLRNDYGYGGYERGVRNDYGRGLRSDYGYGGYERSIRNDHGRGVRNDYGHRGNERSVRNDYGRSVRNDNYDDGSELHLAERKIALVDPNESQANKPENIVEPIIYLHSGKSCCVVHI